MHTDNLINLSFPFYTQDGSILGTSASKSSAVGGGLGIGLGNVLNKKGAKVSVDVGLGFNFEKNESLFASVDMNGDGLPDIVKRERDNIVFYPHIVTRSTNGGIETIAHSFGERKVVYDLPKNDFFRSKSSSFNLNVGINLSNRSGSFGGSIGINQGFSRNTTNIFITDANGDQMPDISVDKKIYFNYLDRETNETHFSMSSEPTENLIVKGAEITVTDPEDEEDSEIVIPAYDVVKVWEPQLKPIIMVFTVISFLSLRGHADFTMVIRKESLI